MMLRAYYAAGLSAKSRGDDRKAAAHFTESAALADKSRDPREWVIINYSLASAHRSCGNYKESEVLCRQIVPLCTKEHGAEHQLTLGSRYGLANVFLEQGMHPGGVPEPFDHFAILGRCGSLAPLRGAFQLFVWLPGVSSLRSSTPG